VGACHAIIAGEITGIEQVFQALVIAGGMVAVP